MKHKVSLDDQNQTDLVEEITAILEQFDYEVVGAESNNNEEPANKYCDYLLEINSTTTLQ